MRNLDVVNELALILHGDHPAWEGDRRANGYAFLVRVSSDMPDEAKALAEDMADNVADYSNETGLSPRTVWAAAKVLAGVRDGGPL